MNSSRVRIRLIGGIGSGKSTVARLLSARGASVIDADTIGHEVLAPNGAAYGEVTSRWPECVVDGEIDRGALGRVVFDDPAQLRELEMITHPHIRDRILDLIAGAGDPSVQVVEMPLVDSFLGEGWITVTVDAADELRLRRAIDRGLDEQEARTRMAAQPDRREWLLAADLIVPNGDGLESLGHAVDSLWEAVTGNVPT